MSSKIQIPTDTIEQEFAVHERCGYQKGLTVNASRITELQAEIEALEGKLDSVKQSNKTLFQSMQAQELRIEAQRKDAERYQKHCRNAQVAAWCGLDPNAPDVLKQLDVYIDAAIAKDTQLSTNF